MRDAQSLLKDEEDLVIAVYDYWLAKRLRLGRALIPAVKHERRDGTSSNNPYLAFRKRTEKMQTRKVGASHVHVYALFLTMQGLHTWFYLGGGGGGLLKVYGMVYKCLMVVYIACGLT